MLVLFLSFWLTQVFASDFCKTAEWRELSNEATVLKDSKFASRQGTRLEITLANGKKQFFEDKKNGIEFAFYRVVAIAPDGSWIYLYRPHFERPRYQLLHRNSGRSESFLGCVVWDKSGKYFAAISEDWDSGMTQNDASLWYCKDPSVSCKKIWGASEGGKAATWVENRLTFTLTRMNFGDGSKTKREVLCLPENNKPHCK